MKKRKILLVLVGNIGCGKTTVARKLIKRGYVAIARDYLRYSLGLGEYIFDPYIEPSVWATEQFMLKSMMSKGVGIVVDEVGVSKKFRESYFKTAYMYGYKAYVVEMERLPMEEAVARRLGSNHGTTPKEVWEMVWKKFDSQYDVPDRKEGFCKVLRRIK